MLTLLEWIVKKTAYHLFYMEQYSGSMARSRHLEAVLYLQAKNTSKSMINDLIFEQILDIDYNLSSDSSKRMRPQLPTSGINKIICV